MNARGHYGNNRSAGRADVGSSLVHVLELKQRYENVRNDAVSVLLRDLSSDGTIASLDNHRWQAALRDGSFVNFAWYQPLGILEVTITDKQPWPTAQVTATRRRYEALLARITSLLRSYRATEVGASVYGPSDLVGITLYHSVGDRADAVKQMAVDWDALYQALASQVGELTIDPKSPSGFHITTQKEWDANPPDPKKVTWWKSYALPIIKEWVKFKRDQLGTDRTFAADYIAFAERFQTNWDVYEGWKKKLDNLRAEAQKRGFSVELPKSTDLPTTVWADAGSALEKGAGAVGSGIGDVWKTLKYGVWGILGIGAIVAISSVASNLKSGKDPAEKYMEMIRMARKPRSARGTRALAASEQLALPAGEGA